MKNLLINLTTQVIAFILMLTMLSTGNGDYSVTSLIVTTLVFYIILLALPTFVLTTEKLTD